MRRVPRTGVTLAARLAAVAVAAALGCGPALAEAVDVNLVLAVDSSGSIDDGEFRLQREGYARALTHPKVLAAIRRGPYRSIG